MRLGKIRHTITRICWRLLVGTVETVPESNQICEFDCRATECDWEKWERCERRLSGYGAVRGPGAASFPLMQPSANGTAGISEEDRKCLSASDVAKTVLGSNSSASISNVLVLGTEGSTPLKRVEISFADPDEVPDRLTSLASAFERNGVEFRAVWNPAMPATEIWLTSPLHDGRKTLLSCAASVGAQLAQRLPA
jgi:hypothetical protein